MDSGPIWTWTWAWIWTNLGHFGPFWAYLDLDLDFSQFRGSRTYKSEESSSNKRVKSLTNTNTFELFKECC